MAFAYSNALIRLIYEGSLPVCTDDICSLHIFSILSLFVIFKKIIIKKTPVIFTRTKEGGCDPLIVCSKVRTQKMKIGPFLLRVSGYADAKAQFEGLLN